MKPIISCVLLFLVLSSCVTEMEAKRNSKALMKARMEKASAESFVLSFIKGMVGELLPFKGQVALDSIILLRKGFQCDFSFISQLKASKVSKKELEKLTVDMHCGDVSNDKCLELLKKAYDEKAYTLKYKALSDSERTRLANEKDYIGSQINERSSGFSFFNFFSYFTRIRHKLTLDTVKNYLSIIQQFFAGMSDCLEKSFSSIYDMLKEKIGDYAEEALGQIVGDNILQYFTKAVKKIPGAEILASIYEFFYAETNEEKAEIGGKILGSILKTMVFPVKKKK